MMEFAANCRWLRADSGISGAGEAQFNSRWKTRSAVPVPFGS